MTLGDIGSPAGARTHERERGRGRWFAVGHVRRERLADERRHRPLLLPRDGLEIALERLVEKHGCPFHITYDSIPRVQQADVARAAEHFNWCRVQGVQGSTPDFLLCAVAERRNLPILTNDADFTRVAAILPVRLRGRVE